MSSLWARWCRSRGGSIRKTRRSRSIRVALAIRNEAKAAPYERALRDAGLDPVIFAPDSGTTLDRVCALMLTGGTDVDPALYNAVRIPESDIPDRERDVYESNLLRAAIACNLPVLAICRGSQLFNVVCGGTLIQHVPNSEKHKQRTGGASVHDVTLEDPMASVFGTSRIAVNSRHHQAVDRLGQGLAVTARSAEDGIIEGFTLPNARFAWAVQWHPEEMTDDERQARLFRAFANSVVPG